MPVPRPLDARELGYLIPQALPIAIPVGLMMAVALGRKMAPSGPLAVWIVAAGLACSVMSFLTLAWWAPASNQAFRIKVVGFEIPKGENELTLGELKTRIEQIRAFDPAAPARRLSVRYHSRWALSVAPMILAVFALVTTRRTRARALNGATTVVGSGAFVFLLTLTSYLSFHGSISPPMAAWLPNLTFLGVTATVMMWSRRVRNSARPPQSGT